MSVSTTLPNTSHPIDSYIGKKLREHRKKMGLSQASLAKMLGISHQLIQKYEQGVTRISVSTLYEISRIINVPPGFFYDGFIPPEQAQPEKEDSNVIPMKRATSFKLLLIEDSPADEVLTRRAIEAHMEELSLEVISAHDGIDALRYLRDSNQTAKPVDLILLDLNIPKKHGLEVLKEIKNDRGLMHIPVIAMTHSINALEMQETYKKYISGFIRKSFDVKDFEKDISTLIDYWFRTVVLPTNF